MTLLRVGESRTGLGAHLPNDLRHAGAVRQSGAVERAESAVAYDGLPISSGGAHGLGRVSARSALADWTDFLSTCTQPQPVSCFFDLPDTPNLRVDRKTAKLIERSFPPAQGVPKRFAVPTEQIGEAVSLFESLEPLPTNPWGMAPVWLWLTADFKLLAPGGGGVWPGQDPARFDHFQTPAGVSLGSSSTRLILQAKRSMGLTLSVPDAADQDLAVLVPWLQEALPMRLSVKQWTRWTLTRNGRSYRGKRISPPGLR